MSVPVLHPTPYVVVWLLFVFAWAASFAIRIGFSTLLAPIMKELDLSYAGGGALAAAFFYAYVAMQVPAGLLGDHFGRRRILILGLLGSACATVFTGLAGSFAVLFMGRLLTGVCQGALFSNDRAIITAVTPPARIALGQGVSFSGPGLGIVLGLLLGGVLAEAFSWRVALFIFALVPLLAAAAIRTWVPALPPAPSPASLGQRFGRVLRQRRLWVLSAAGACGIYVQFLLATWAPLMFLEVGVTDLGRAGGYASLQGLAAIVGPAAGGWLDDRLRPRGIGHAAIAAGGLVALAASMGLLALALAGRSVFGVAVALVAAAFFVWSIWGPLHAAFGELTGRADLAMTFGLANSICFTGAILGPLLTGVVRDVAGSFGAGCVVGAAVALAGALVALTPAAASRRAARA